VIFIAVALLILLAASVQPGGELDCSIVTPNCPNQSVFRISALTNAHAGTSLGSGYSYHSCCFAGDTLTDQCIDINGSVFNVYSQNNSHIEQYTLTNYPIRVCLGAENANVTCHYELDTDCADPTYQCMASAASTYYLSNITNMHIADCGVYPLSICCRMECDPDTYYNSDCCDDSAGYTVNAPNMAPGLSCDAGSCYNATGNIIYFPEEGPNNNASCCGDDTEEFYNISRVDPTGGVTQDATRACCDDPDDCRYNAQCFSTNASYDLSADGDQDICDQRVWYDQDYSAYFCEDLGGNIFEDDTSWDTRPSEGNVNDSSNTAFMCCGDDSTEDSFIDCYTTGDPDTMTCPAGTDSCCNAPTDCVATNSTCWDLGRVDGVFASDVYEWCGPLNIWHDPDENASFCELGYYTGQNDSTGGCCGDDLAAEYFDNFTYTTAGECCCGSGLLDYLPCSDVNSVPANDWFCVDASWCLDQPGDELVDDDNNFFFNESTTQCGCSDLYLGDVCRFSYTGPADGLCNATTCCTADYPDDNDDAAFNDDDCGCDANDNGYRCDANADRTWDGVCAYNLTASVWATSTTTAPCT